MAIKLEHDKQVKPVKVEWVYCFYCIRKNEIPPHFVYEIKTKGYDVIGVNESPIPNNSGFWVTAHLPLP